MDMNVPSDRFAPPWPVALSWATAPSVTERTDFDVRDVSDAARGDMAAFERLYRRHHARIHRLACRLVGRDDADDALQEVFFRTWTKLHSYRANAAFSTWLHRLAVNVLLRRASRIRTTAARTVAVADDTVAAPAAASDIKLDLDAALASLPPDLRTAVVLHDIEGLSHEEIGRLLNISLTAARMRLYRARLALRAFAAGERRDD
jgi:RNA polymerase sigma-70 factor (ECF subfamily)